MTEKDKKRWDRIEELFLIKDGIIKSIEDELYYGRGKNINMGDIKEKINSWDKFENEFEKLRRELNKKYSFQYEKQNL